MYTDGKDKNIGNTFQYNEVPYNTTLSYDLTNKHTCIYTFPTMSPKSKHYKVNFTKAEFMAELLSLSALYCTGVPNKVTTESNKRTKSMCLLKLLK